MQVLGIAFSVCRDFVSQAAWRCAASSEKVSMRVHAAVSTRDTYAVLFSNPMRARACQVKTQSRLFGADNSQATEAVDNGHMQGFFSGVVT